MSKRRKAPGTPPLIAGIDADNAPSIRLHETFGFAFAGRIVKAGYKFGRWLDLVFYQKLLTGPQHLQQDL
ncbi:MAG: GNAT family N-acetyltransferase [Bilophila sp.]